MTESESNNEKKSIERSVSDRSAATIVTGDDSLASLFLRHGVTVRDFVLMSFLSEKGPMNSVELARVVGIEPTTVTRSLGRLSAAGLVLRDPADFATNPLEIARLTSRGHGIVGRANSQT